jgi:citrate synthase
MSHWMEMVASKSRIGRPRQLYTGEKIRDVK